MNYIWKLVIVNKKCYRLENQYLIINLNLPPETSQDTSTVLPSAYGPMVVEASRPDSSTITGVLGGTENRDYVLLNVVLDKKPDS